VVNKQAAFLQTASSIVAKVSCHMHYDYCAIRPKSSVTQQLQSLHHANYVGGHRLLIQTAEASLRSSRLVRGLLGIGSFHEPGNVLRKHK
jgi:hypothetical protein